MRQKIEVVICDHCKDKFEEPRYDYTHFYVKAETEDVTFDLCAPCQFKLLTLLLAEKDFAPEALTYVMKFAPTAVLL
jgi:hypothetical protein